VQSNRKIEVGEVKTAVSAWQAYQDNKSGPQPSLSFSLSIFFPLSLLLPLSLSLYLSSLSLLSLSLSLSLSLLLFHLFLQSRSHLPTIAPTTLRERTALRR
jgi:hypothetical protein